MNIEKLDLEEMKYNTVFKNDVIIQKKINELIGYCKDNFDRLLNSHSKDVIKKDIEDLHNYINKNIDPDLAKNTTINYIIEKYEEIIEELIK